MLGISLLIATFFAIAIVIAASWSHALESPVFGRKLLRAADFGKAAGLLAIMTAVVTAGWHDAGAAVSVLHARLFGIAIIAVAGCCALSWVLRPIWQAWRSFLVVLNFFVLALAVGVWLGTTDWASVATSVIAAKSVWLVLPAAWLVQLSSRMLSTQRSTAFERLAALIRAGDARSQGREL
jgi:hypothetical protein